MFLILSRKYYYFFLSSSEMIVDETVEISYLYLHAINLRETERNCAIVKNIVIASMRMNGHNDQRLLEVCNTIVGFLPFLASLTLSYSFPPYY